MPQNLFTLTLWRDDMGQFKQPGCRNSEDALWHVNSARDHDGLPRLTLSELQTMLVFPDSSARATLTLQHSA